MRTVWAVVVAMCLGVAVEARADTVYLKDGQTVWGKEIVEEGDTVVVKRPGETLRLPKRDVGRIERERVSVPRYYEPPSTGAGSKDEGSRPAESAASPTPPSPAAAPPSGGGAEQPAPTLLPPPPPPSGDRPS